VPTLMTANQHRLARTRRASAFACCRRAFQHIFCLRLRPIFGSPGAPQSITARIALSRRPGRILRATVDCCAPLESPPLSSPLPFPFRLAPSGSGVSGPLRRRSCRRRTLQNNRTLHRLPHGGRSLRNSLRILLSRDSRRGAPSTNLARIVHLPVVQRSFPCGSFSLRGRKCFVTVSCWLGDDCPTF
jgi:hypothetical protein